MDRYDKEPYLICLEANAELKLLIGYFLASFEETNPKDSNKGETVEISECEEVSDVKIASRPILSTYRWRELTQDL